MSNFVSADRMIDITIDTGFINDKFFFKFW